MRIHRGQRTLQLALLASFLVATFLLLYSHHLVSSSKSDDQQRLLSVPLPPPRREAAKGGLPPIPDPVKKKLRKYDYDESHKAASTETAGRGRNRGVGAAEQAFPMPSDAVPAGSFASEIILKPTFGSHRPDKNAVFAFAEGYDIIVYVTFIESLKLTNFTGDVVLAVSNIEVMKRGVENYLRWYSQRDSLRVISYALSWECYKKSGVRCPQPCQNHFRECKIRGLYSDGNNASLAPAEDPRVARPVATARYELYWIFSRQYHGTSSILVVDARDTYFQSNPFAFDPPHTNRGKVVCRLDLFEENFGAINIGKSEFNSRWIKSAYGQQVLEKMSSKPVICSGSSLGTQRAVELYSVAMVAQFDKTKCKQVGCDQGFHNYLFYEGRLDPFLAENDCAVEVHKQGEGIVNNLAAMRNSPLRSQAVLRTGDTADDIIVVNKDQSPSPVVHQFDRDAELKRAIKKMTARLLAGWKSNTKGSD
ncbi:hypothetical protein ACHAWF_011592 [Thalassiosira exigua]